MRCCAKVICMQYGVNRFINLKASSCSTQVLQGYLQIAQNPNRESILDSKISVLVILMTDALQHKYYTLAYIGCSGYYVDVHIN